MRYQHRVPFGQILGQGERVPQTIKAVAGRSEDDPVGQRTPAPAVRAKNGDPVDVNRKLFKVSTA